MKRQPLSAWLQGFLFLFVWAFCQLANAQSISEKLGLKAKVYPPSPTASAFAKYVEMPVSHHTGVPNISLPLFQVSERELSVPVTLSYHAAGLRVSDIAGWVGTGWSLNYGGMITRTMRGRPDEDAQGYLNTFDFFQNPGNIDAFAENINRMDDLEAGRMDSQPDLFNFSCGSHSGRFYFMKKNGQVKIATVPYQNLKIESTGPGGNFKITTPDGIRYEFNQAEYSNDGSGINYKSSWVLTKIISPNNYSINFEYEDHQLVQTLQRSEMGVYAIYQSGGFASDCSLSNQGYGTNTSTVSNPNLSISALKLRKITFSNGYLLFTSSSGATTSIDKRLDKIQLYDSNGSLVKGVRLDYGLMNCVGVASNPGSRLKLNSVTEFGTNEACLLPPHLFAYDENNVPSFDTKGVDHWGYYNGQSGNTSLLPTINYENLQYPQGGNSVNREPNGYFMQGGTLKQITYPTGGSTLFTYESHRIGDETIGGLRIRKVEFTDALTGVTRQKVYSYPDGRVMYRPRYFQRQTIRNTGPCPQTGIDNCVWDCPFLHVNSNAQNVPNGLPHVAYIKVEEADNESASNGKITYTVDLSFC